MRQSDFNLVQLKQAERIVHVLIDYLNVDESTGITSNPEELEKLADMVRRVLNPEFENVNDNFESSNIGAIAYDPVSAVLQVDFNSGNRYHYFGVEEDLADRFEESESKGKFFHKEIRENYAYAKIA